MTHRARRIAVSILALTLVLTSAAQVRGEALAWDQAKVTDLAKQLASTSSDLYTSFYKQPVPTVASAQAKAYHRLKDQVRRIRSEAERMDALRDLTPGVYDPNRWPFLPDTPVWGELRRR